jgi:hypothetical protein
METGTGLVRALIAAVEVKILHSVYHLYWSKLQNAFALVY